MNSNVGTFNNVTINAKEQATAGRNVSYLTANQPITVTATGNATETSTSSATSPLIEIKIMFCLHYYFSRSKK